MQTPQGRVSELQIEPKSAASPIHLFAISRKYVYGTLKDAAQMPPDYNLVHWWTGCLWASQLAYILPKVCHTAYLHYDNRF